MPSRIPEVGRDPEAILSDMAAMKAADTDWRGGRVFSLVYHAGHEHERLLERAHNTFASANLLNPMAFKSLKRMEAEVVQMAARLLNGPDGTVGAMTSGGTESILLAVYTYRERARKARGLRGTPEIVVPVTAHPAFDKGAHYFGVKLRKVDVRDDFTADPKAMARAINSKTVALVASAPQYPHGVVDPIAEIAAVAKKHGVGMHVDACVGGFVLPWVERLGRTLPIWDFRANGVTSMSADLHKYGYTAKGASVLLWESMDYMRWQFFVATDWPGGIYASPSIPGTRPGGPVAAAWAAMNSLGEKGYLDLTRRALETADALRDGVRSIPELSVLGESNATIVCWGANNSAVDVYAVADRMESRGWTIDRQQRPASVHLTVTANHAPIVEPYIADLRASVDEVKRDPNLVKSGNAPMYGMMAKAPLRAFVGQSVRKVMEAMYAPGAVTPDLKDASSGGGMVDRFIAKHGDKVNDVLDKIEAAKMALKRRRS
ncbi:MAG: aspartate aminotransferase family protein [Polyangiaceae bacterium]|nr:aspartate aminotransferase family protein [Polyangiaceae bacterium]